MRQFALAQVTPAMPTGWPAPAKARMPGAHPGLVCCRTAFAELYAAQAGKLAEHMAKLRAKETAQREAFKKHVERFIPTQASPACLPGQLLPDILRAQSWAAL